MASFYFQTGLVIKRLGQILEYESRYKDELYFEDPATGERETIKESQFWKEQHTKSITIVDAFSTPEVLDVPTESEKEQFTHLSDLPQKYQDDAIRKVQYVKKLREAGITKGQKFLIADAARRIAKEIEDPLGVPGTSTITRWWRELAKQKYEVYAVVSGHARRNRKSPLDDDSNALIEQVINDEFLKDTRPTATGAYSKYKDELKRENKSREAAGLAPLVKASERTFYARINARPKYEVMIARYGREAARHHFKMIKGHLPAEHPLDFVEIDHSPLNLYVIDDLCFLPLGRPWVTVIKDRFSRILLGFYISFRATGLDSIFGAIKHSLTSHHLAYELWPDLENPWPAFGLGHYYVSDRGGDFRSPRYRAALVALGSLWQYCETRTPWHKAPIERFFLTLDQTLLECMPGRTFSCLRERGDYNPIKDAVVRFSTFIYMMHKWAADSHNVYAHKRGQANSLDIWMEGIETAPPPYPVCVDELNIALGDRHSGTLSQEGIRFQWLTYADDGRLSELMNRLGKGVSVDYVVSQENLGQIQVLDPKNMQRFAVPCTRPDYANGLSLLQHKYLRREAGVRLERNSAVDILMRTRSRLVEVIAEEIEAKSTANKSHLARIAGINSNAVLEGKPKSITNPFQGQSVEASPSVITPALTPAQAIRESITNVPVFRWGA